MRRLFTALVAAAPLLLIGVPATAVEVIREPTTLFVSAHSASPTTT
jgi:hypothetical protein